MSGPQSNEQSPQPGLQHRIDAFRNILEKYWWILTATTIIGLAVQAVRLQHSQVHYVSNARMMLNSNLPIGDQTQAYDADMDDFFGTQLALMKSSETLDRAKARVAAMHPDVPVDDDVLVDALQEPRTSIFNLTATSNNAKYSQMLLDAVMEEYLAIKRERRSQSTDETLSAVTQQLTRLEQEIRDDEQELLDFQKENSVVFIQQQSDSAAGYLVQLNTEAAGLRKEYELLKLFNLDPDTQPAPTTLGVDPSAADSVKADTIESQFNNVGHDDAYQQAKQKIQLAKAQRDDLSRVLKPKHPKIISLNKQIEEEERLLGFMEKQDIEQLAAHRAGLETQLQSLEQLIKDQEAKSLDLTEKLGKYDEIKGRLDRAQSLYDKLASSIQSVDVHKSIDQENISIMEPASVADDPKSTYIHDLVLGGVLGLMLGGGIVYILIRLDNKIETLFTLEQHFDVPIMGQIPFAPVDKVTGRVPLLVHDDQRHVFMESYRNVRSSLIYKSKDGRSPRVIMGCSAMPGEGKSTVISNLAIMFAFSGSKTLLIDADLRRGVLHDLFQAERTPGLADYLQQKVPWRDTVRKTGYDRLHVIPRGLSPSHPGELLLGPLTELMITEALQEYETILFDSAPILVTDDASNLIPRVEGVILIVRSRFSTLQSTRSALEVLAQRHAALLGVAFNAIHIQKSGYSNYYRFKEYYNIQPET